MEPFNTAPLLNTYGRAPIQFKSGKGALLFDDRGKEYIDLLAGIAVVSLGHAHAGIAAAVSEQIGMLTHVSNLFFNVPMCNLAKKLREITGWGRVFFANSGAEANECAIKLVRKWAGKDRFKILCAQDSFHGRTLAALAATGQPAKWAGFEPLPTGFVHLPFNDLAAFEHAVDDQTAAILIEPILGEGGIIPATPEFLKGLRSLASQRNLALIFDEVQSGIGRTGAWWAFQNFGVKPDLFTSAKALGNGLPIAACIVDEPFASTFVPGDHATTYGGGAVVCAAALTVIEQIETGNLLERVKMLEKTLVGEIQTLPHITEVRGRGLMLGIVLEGDYAKSIAATLLERGVIVNAVRDNVIRLTPPFVIEDAQLASALATMRITLESI